MGLDRAKKVVNEKHERILLEMTKQPGNDICADCCAKAPRWASHNIGIFLCIRCGSIHRKMGTHISKVKSISLDSWTSDQVENMKQWGNLKANAKWNPRPDLNPVPVNATDNEMEKYIRNKYERKTFMDPKPPQPKNHSATRSGSSAPSVSQTHLKRSDSSYRDRGSTNESALRKLNDMGFTDNVRNREVLATTNGDINAAIEILCRLSSSSSSNDATKPTPTKSRLSTASEDEKLTALWNLGFQDEAKNRDALRRTGGNVEVAAAILNDERSKPREKEPAAIVSTPSPGTPQQDQSLISLPVKKQPSLAQNQLLIDSPSMSTQSISSQQSATVNSIGLGVNNPFGLPQQQQQQQLLQAQQQLQYKQQIQQQQQQQLQYQLLLQQQQQTSNQQPQTSDQNRFDKNSILSLYNISRTNSVPLGVSSLGGTNNNTSRSNSMPSNISSLSGISNNTHQHNTQTTSGLAQNNHLNQIQPQIQQTTGYNSLTGVSAFGSMTPTNGLVGTPGLTGLGTNTNQLFNSTPSPGLGIRQSLGMSVMTPTQLNSNSISSIGINNNSNSNAFGFDTSLKQQNSTTGFTASSVSGGSTPFEDLISPFGGLSLQTQSPQQQPPSTSPALFGLSQPQTPQSQTPLGFFDIQQQQQLQRTATTPFLTGNGFLQPQLQQKTPNLMNSFGGGGLLQPQRQQTQNTNSTWNNVNQFQGY